MIGETVNVAELILQGLGILFALMIQTIVLILYLLGRLNRGDAEVEQRCVQAITALHARVDDVTAGHLAKDEFSRHFDHIEHALDRINGRLDTLTDRMLTAPAAGVGD